MARWSFLRSSGGLSLIETMIAMVVLVGGVTALRHVFPTHLATERQATERLQATLLGQQHVERLRLRGFTALEPLQSATMSATCVPSAVAETAERFCVQEHLASESPDLLAIHVRVAWPRPVATHEVRLATYISRSATP